MIADCAAIGMNWQRVTLSDYLETVEAYNERSAPQERAPADPDRLDRMMRARGAVH